MTLGPNCFIQRRRGLGWTFRIGRHVLVCKDLRQERLYFSDRNKLRPSLSIGPLHLTITVDSPWTQADVEAVREFRKQCAEARKADREVEGE